MVKFLCGTFHKCNFDCAINEQQNLFVAYISLEHFSSVCSYNQLLQKAVCTFVLYNELFVTYKKFTRTNLAEAFSFSEMSNYDNVRLHGTNAWLCEISMLSRIRHWQIYFPLKLTIQCWCHALHNEGKKQHPSVSALSECISAVHLQHIVAFPYSTCC